MVDVGIQFTYKYVNFGVEFEEMFDLLLLNLQFYHWFWKIISPPPSNWKETS